MPEKLVGILYRRFHNDDGTNTLLELYTMLIGLTWNMQPQSGILLQPAILTNWRILRNLHLKSACTKHWNLGYQDLLELTNCPSLQSHRLYFKLCTLYKIVHNLVYFPPNVISSKCISVTPEPFLHLPFARTTAYYSSFVPSSDLFGITELA